MITHKQLSLAEIYSDCETFFKYDKPKFLTLLQNTINLEEFIPSSFINKFYLRTGRPRKYPLHSMIWALILQKIFSIPTDSLLIIFLRMSKEVKDFCGFTKVPDASKFTHFEQDLILDLRKMFDELVDIPEPICQKIDYEKAAMTIFDTSGVEAFVAENNPKYSNKIIKQIKAYKKINNLPDSFNPYSVAYGSMPKSAASNNQIRLMYINGHFCYSYKFGIVTNGLGIVRNLSLYNKDFISSHPEITDVQTSNSPDNDKSLHDTKVLIPVLKDLFNKHPLIRPKTFLGDDTFDSCLIYDSLLTDLKFSEIYIPLNKRFQVKNKDYTINEDGIPCCTNNASLPLKYQGASKRPNGLIRYKFVCPKVKWRKNSSGKYKASASVKIPVLALLVVE